MTIHTIGPTSTLYAKETFSSSDPNFDLALDTGIVKIQGYLPIASGSTLGVTFAQKSATGASSVAAGAIMKLTRF